MLPTTSAVPTTATTATIRDAAAATATAATIPGALGRAPTTKLRMPIDSTLLH